LSGLLLYLYVVLERAPKFRIAGSHIFITGGSTGIGLTTAIHLVKLKAKVTIIARNQKNIDQAVSEISAAGGADSVVGISCDVSNQQALIDAVKQAQDAFGPIGALICSAGVSRPGRFEELPNDEFTKQMTINYFGIVYSCKAVLPSMKSLSSGRIILISSMAGQSGIIGFSAYSPTKFAVRGLAECMHMELKPYNIFVSVSNPPDVDTPMLKGEMPFKPIECTKISEGSGLFTSDDIATKIVANLKNWKFFIQNGFDGVLLGYLTSGTSPASSIADELINLFGLGLIRLVSLGYRYSYNNIVAKYAKERINGKLNDKKSS